MNDIIINKVKSIQHCLKRVKEEYTASGENFLKDYTRQDAAVLNLTRACEQAIDLANHIIKTKKLGIPDSSADSFLLLTEANIISSELAMKMVKMTGFRNIAIHMYQKLDTEILISIIKNNLYDLEQFSEVMIKQL